MRKLVILLSLAALAAIVSAASAKDDCGPAALGDPGCCARCERHAPCQKKTCQVVCEMKKEKKHKWAVECTEFCPLLPGCKDRSRDPGCGDPGCGDPGCADPGQGCGGKCDPPPRCGRHKCVKKLVKKEYEVEVPVYKCVVQYLCDGCGKAEPAAPAAGPAPKAAAAPPLPPVPPAPPAPTNRSAAQGGRESSPTAAVRFVGG